MEDFKWTWMTWTPLIIINALVSVSTEWLRTGGILTAWQHWSLIIYCFTTESILKFYVKMFARARFQLAKSQQNKEAYYGILKDKCCILFILITFSSKIMQTNKNLVLFRFKSAIDIVKLCLILIRIVRNCKLEMNQNTLFENLEKPTKYKVCILFASLYLCLAMHGAQKEERVPPLSS